MQIRLWITFAISGAIAVVLGALGAHALREVLEARQLLSFETAVRYQLFHTLLGLILVYRLNDCVWVKRSVFLLLIGIVLFSGSIYLLSTQAITGLSVGWLGPITPIGGLCLIAAWGLLIPAAKGLCQAKSPNS